jgi:hypothetical protein
MNRINIKGELVSFKNTENFIIDGILYESSNAINTIIHVHGSYGNFYQNQFLRHMAKYYTESGYNFLAFNLRAHDGFAEGYKNQDDFEYVGGAVSAYDTYIADIRGAVQFASQFSDKIILQGHSMGCDKVIGYMIRESELYDCILLSPSDSYALQSLWLKRQFNITVEEQVESLKMYLVREGNKNKIDWLPFNSYGLYYTHEEHFLPVSSQTLLSILTGESFWTFNIEHPRQYYLNSNCLVYLGGMDELQTRNHDAFLQFIGKRFKTMKSLFFESSEHMLDNVGDRVSREIVSWLNGILS